MSLTIRVTAPDGRSKELRVSALPTEEEARLIKRKMFPDLETEPISAETPDPIADTLDPETDLGGPKRRSSGFFQSAADLLSEDKFTETERAIVGGLPIAAGIAGEVISTRLKLPRPIRIATVAGLSSAGRLLGDAIAPFLGGPNRTAADMMKRAKNEFAASVAVDTALVGGGRLGGLVRKGLQKVAKPISELRIAQSSKRNAEFVIAGLQHELKIIGNSVQDIISKKTASFNAIRKTRGKNLTKKWNTVVSTIGELTDTVAKGMFKGTNTALSKLGDQYDVLAKKFPTHKLDNFGAVTDAFKGISEGEIAKNSPSTINAVARSIKAVGGDKALDKETVGLTIPKAMVLRRDLSKTVRRLYNSGKGDIADSLSEVLQVLDNQINAGTKGAFSELNASYKTTLNLLRANSITKSSIDVAAQGAFEKGATAGSKEAVKQGVRAFKGVIKDFGDQASGKGLLTVSPDEAMAAMRAGETVFDVAKGKAEAIINIPGTLKQTGIPSVIEGAEKLEGMLVDIAKQSVDKGRIESMLKQMQKIPGAEKMTPGWAKTQSAAINKEILENESAQILFRGELMRASEKTRITENLLSIYIAGQTVDKFLAHPFKNIVRTAINLLSFRKWSPILSDILDNSLGSMSDFVQKNPKFTQPMKQFVKDIVAFPIADARREQEEREATRQSATQSRSR